MQGALLPFVDFEDTTHNVSRLALGAFGSKAELCGADLVVEVEGEAHSIRQRYGTIVGKVPCIMENFLNEHNNLRKSPEVRDSRGRQTVVEVINEKSTYGEPFIISAGMVSGPGALPVLSDPRTILSSAMLRGAEQSTTGEGLLGIVG